MADARTSCRSTITKRTSSESCARSATTPRQSGRDLHPHASLVEQRNLVKIVAYHLDLKRAMPTRAYLEVMADRLAHWGFNAILYEVEDKLRFRKHPGLAHLGAWSIEQT